MDGMRGLIVLRIRLDFGLVSVLMDGLCDGFLRGKYFALGWASSI